MSSSPAPVDLSSLSLSSRPSQHDHYDYEGNAGVNRQQYQFQTSPHIQSQYNPLSVGQSPLKKPTRAGLPTQWLDSPNTGIDGRSISSEDFSSAGGSPPLSSVLANAGNLNQGQIDDDDVIPTAIVIKNIPFNVKRETLLDIIASLAIPTPYAFNYHLDQQGSFRGLAFANFRQSVDADAVVAALNGFDVQGRKLRVEYKKVLQAGEKERIEREKAIRRMRSMQIEKEHVVPQPQYDDFGPVMPPAFAPQRSFSGSPYTSQMQQQQQQQQLQMGHGMPQHQYSPPNVAPMPVPQPYRPVHSPPVSSPPPSSEKSSTELDLNDPSTLEIYSRILLFKDDRMRDELAFSRTLSPKQRRVVHLIAQKLGVYHYSMGEGDERYAVVTRIDPQRQQQPQRHTISRAPSSYLAATAAQQQQQMTPNALRVKKSMPDLNALRSQAPRISTRASNGNLREGYATIASPSRRSPGGYGSLLNGGMFNNGGTAIPPVPHLPSIVTNLNIMGGGGGGGVNESPGGVVRQPRGPGAGGFGSRRDSRVAVSESNARLEARSHEPLEL